MTRLSRGSGVGPRETDSSSSSETMGIRRSCRDAVPLSEIAWVSSDTTTRTWRTGRGSWSVQTSDPARGRHLAKLTGVTPIALVVSGGYEEVFHLSARKLRTKTVRRVLRGGAA